MVKHGITSSTGGPWTIFSSLSSKVNHSSCLDPVVWCTLSSHIFLCPPPPPIQALSGWKTGVPNYGRWWGTPLTFLCDSRLMGGFWSRPTNLWFLLHSYQTGCVHQVNCIRTAQRGRMTSCQVGAWPVSAPVNPTCSTSPALHMSPVYQDVPVLLGEWRLVAEYKPRRSDYILLELFHVPSAV